MIDEYEHLIDKNGLCNTWEKNILPALVAFLRPDMTIEELPESENPVSLGLLKLASRSKRLGELYEYGLAYADKNSKKRLGQYYTPRDVATFMSKKLLEQLKSENLDLSDVSVVDPCCGCGGLLFPLLDLVERPWEIVSEHLRLVDFDQCAIDITKTMLLICYAPENSTVSLSSIPSHVGDFLSDEILLSENDAIIANPPYGRTSADAYPEYITSQSRDLYALFMEKCLSAGFVSIITPQSFVGSSKFEPLRSLMMKRSHGIVFPYDNIPSPLFCGRKHGVFNTNTSNSVRAAITCARQGKGDWKVLPLLRFRSKERDVLFECSERISAQAYTQSNSSLWLKLPKMLENVFFGNDKICLSDIVCSEKTPYALHIPTTLRYFTSASVRNLNRSSKTTLYFKSKEDMSIAYVLMNSSVAYAWWRICDGGINLTSSVLKSIPFKYPDKDAVRAIVRRFDALSSLEDKRVQVKMNAGKPNETIKFDAEEISVNTKLIAPGFDSRIYRALSGFHANEIAVMEKAWSS